MDKKEYFEKILDRSAEELVKEFFPNGLTTQEKIGIKKLLESVGATDYELGKKFLS